MVERLGGQGEGKGPEGHPDGTPNKQIRFKFGGGVEDIDSASPRADSTSLPFIFTQNELPRATGEEGSVIQVLRCLGGLEDATPEWKRKAQENFLWLLHLKRFQRLGELNQLGLITTPRNVFLNEVAEYFSKQAGAVGIKSPLNFYSENQPAYIGGTRRQHSLYTAALCAEGGKRMELDYKTYFAFIVAGLCHDVEQSALSHVGEETISIALTIPEIKQKLASSIHRDATPSSHEKRSAEIIESSEFARSLLDCGINPSRVSEIIREEHYGLGLFDTAAYLYKDAKNISKDPSMTDEFPEDLIPSIMSSINGHDPETKHLRVTREGVTKITELLDRRIEAYRTTYTHPETLKIETIMVDTLVAMIKDGVINVEDFLFNGTDDGIAIRARTIAKRQPEYALFTDALDGRINLNAKTVNPQLILPEYKNKDPYTLREDVRKKLKERYGIELPPEAFYIVLPFDPHKKAITVECEGNLMILHADRDYSVHPYQDSVLILTANNIPIVHQERIAEVLTGEAKADEQGYFYTVGETIENARLFTDLCDKGFIELLEKRYPTVKTEEVNEFSQIIWQSKPLSYVSLVKRVKEGAEEAEYFLQARFAKDFSPEDNRIDRYCRTMVLDKTRYEELLGNSAQVIQLLLGHEGDTPSPVADWLRHIQESLPDAGIKNDYQHTKEITITLRGNKGEEIAKLKLQSEKPALLKEGREIVLLPQTVLTNRVIILIGPHATHEKIREIKQIFDLLEGVKPIPAVHILTVPVD